MMLLWVNMIDLAHIRHDRGARWHGAYVIATAMMVMVAHVPETVIAMLLLLVVLVLLIAQALLMTQLAAIVVAAIDCGGAMLTTVAIVINMVDIGMV